MKLMKSSFKHEVYIWNLSWKASPGMKMLLYKSYYGCDNNSHSYKVALKGFFPLKILLC